MSSRSCRPSSGARRRAASISSSASPRTTCSSSSRALGLSHEIFGTRLLPIGTLYDPFIARGLDALNYACYQDARFMIVATPSGVTLAPEGGAHQSIHTPLIGIGQPGLLSYEPAYVDELAVLMRFGLEHVQQPKGSSIYLRLSTRSLQQPERTLSADQQADIVNGGYWYAAPERGADIAIVCMGAVTPKRSPRMRASRATSAAPACWC